MSREQLSGFLENVYKDLDLVVHKLMPKFVPKELPEDLYTLTKDAFLDLRTPLEKAVEDIGKIDEDELREVGLTGIQLDIKIRSFNSLRERFRTTLSLSLLKLSLIHI